MRYIDLDFYISQDGSLTGEQFYSVIKKAEDMIDNVTANRAAKTTGYKRERVKKVVAALCDELYRQRIAPDEKELSSVSNGDRSERYVVMSTEEKKTVLQSVIFEYLSGTGLMGAL